jgi:hypothetical protein
MLELIGEELTRFLLIYWKARVGADFNIILETSGVFT